MSSLPYITSNFVKFQLCTITEPILCQFLCLNKQMTHVCDSFQLNNVISYIDVTSMQLVNCSLFYSHIHVVIDTLNT